MHSFDDLVALARIAPIPAPALRAVTLAQWMHESARGTSRLAIEHANFAALPWHETMRGYAIPAVPAVAASDAFCEFSGPGSFIRGYWRSTATAFPGWERFAADPQGYITFLASKGQGAAIYAQRVLALMAEAERLLTKSAGGAATIPALRAPEALPALTLEQPAFEHLAGVRHLYSGVSGGPEGAVLYRADSLPGSTADAEPDIRARQILAWGAARNLAFSVISRTGRIYVPANSDWQAWGQHAGVSRCPTTGRLDVSRFYTGIVIDGIERSTNLAGPQREALIRLLLWLRSRYADSFRLGFVFSQNEIGCGQSTHRRASPAPYAALRAELIGRWAGQVAAGGDVAGITRITDEIIRSASECRG